jgi:isopenicillin-N epimerase
MEWVTSSNKSKKIASPSGKVNGQEILNKAPSGPFDEQTVLAAIIKTREQLKAAGVVLPVDMTGVKAVVALGIGNFSQTHSQAQLQLAVLLNMVATTSTTTTNVDVLAFDPAFTAYEKAFLKDVLDINVMVTDFGGKHKARSNSRTLFYMPHCPYRLYSHVLWANWGFNLGKITIVGNSFLSYEIRRPVSSSARQADADVVKLLTPFMAEHVLLDKALLTSVVKKDSGLATLLERALVDTSVLNVHGDHMRSQYIDHVANAKKLLRAHDNLPGVSATGTEEEECVLSNELRALLFGAESRRPSERELDLAAVDDDEFMVSTPTPDEVLAMHPYTPRDVKRKLLMGEGFTNMNHGSFGTLPRAVMDYQRSLVEECESHPDKWFREKIFVKQYASRCSLARLVNCNVRNLVLVENASYAVNAVVHTLLDDEFKTTTTTTTTTNINNNNNSSSSSSSSINNGEKDFGVLVFSNAYKMVLETVDLKPNCFTAVVPIKWPIPQSQAHTVHDRMVAQVEQTLKEHSGKIKLAIFSHMSSMPAMIEPVAALTRVCHKYGAKVLVDGAHAPGHIPVDVPDIGCDYYTGNCHKWLFAPKGAAFFVDTTMSTRPPVVSSSGQRCYPYNFLYTGTRDYTAFCTIPKAMAFYNDDMGGPERVMSYSHAVVTKGAHLCANRWNTQLLVPDNLCGNLLNVILPSRDAAAISRMQGLLDSEENMYIVTASIDPEHEWVEEGQQRPPGRLFFVRLSGQPYVSLNDFECLAELVPKYLKE